jgi:hypothetical protein
MPAEKGLTVARRMILLNENDEVMLTEVEAHNEEQLQQRLKDSPDLLPVDEFGLSDQLVVVGRETTLPSGAVDLLVLARTGDLLVVEMKTGPQNPDFRGALAQATDYGADLWQMTPDVFEATVAARYFASAHCAPRFKGLTSLAEAAKIAWPDMNDADYTALYDRLTRVLATGAFHFVIVAQHFTQPMMTTASYLNEVSDGRARYFLVELVRFTGTGHAAFEARTVLRPPGQASKSSGPSLSETAFLDQITDADYRQALERLFDTSHGLGLRFEWGSAGTSIRLPTPYKAEPISLAWVFPPGTSGWMGLRDVTLGYDITQAQTAEEAQPALASYEHAISRIPGARQTAKSYLKAYTFQPAAFVNVLNATVEALAAIVQEVGSK